MSSEYENQAEVYDGGGYYVRTLSPPLGSSLRLLVPTPSPLPPPLPLP